MLQQLGIKSEYGASGYKTVPGSFVFGKKSIFFADKHWKYRDFMLS